MMSLPTETVSNGNDDGVEEIEVNQEGEAYYDNDNNLQPSSSEDLSLWIPHGACFRYTLVDKSVHPHNNHSNNPSLLTSSHQLLNLSRKSAGPPGVSDELWNGWREATQVMEDAVCVELRTYAFIAVFWFALIPLAFYASDQVGKPLGLALFLLPVLVIIPAYTLYTNYYVRPHVLGRRIQVWIDLKRPSFSECGYFIQYKPTVSPLSMEFIYSDHPEEYQDPTAAARRLKSSTILRQTERLYVCGHLGRIGKDRRHREPMTVLPLDPQLALLYRTMVLPPLRSALERCDRLRRPWQWFIHLVVAGVGVSIVQDLLWQNNRQMSDGVTAALVGVVSGVFTILEVLIKCALDSWIPRKGLEVLHQAAKSSPPTSKQFGKYRFVLKSWYHGWGRTTAYFTIELDDEILA